MKKTISVDIHGRNFIIDEAAYARLNEYLEEIKQHFGKDANVEEVMNDIEASISEKLQSAITSYKDVVTLEDIERLIKIMGTPKDFDEAIGASETKQDEEQATDTKKEAGEPRTKRKLYRDMDSAMLAGVSSGLAKYFDVDVVLVRILFIVFTITGGFAIPLYIILWIAMPEAKTVNQKLEMQGETPTLSSLERLTQQKETKTEKSALRKILEAPFTLLRVVIGAFQKIWKWLGPVFRIFFGSLLIIGSLLGLAAFGVGAFYAILNINAPYKFNHIPIVELTHTIPFVWIFVTGFLSLTIPVLFLLLGGISLIRKKALINFAGGSLLVGLWMVSGIACTALSLRYFPETYAKASSHPLLKEEQRNIDADGVETLSVSGSRLRIVLSSGTSTRVTAEGRKIDLDGLEIKKEQKSLSISQGNHQKEEYCIACEPRRITVTIGSDLIKHITATKGAELMVNGKLKNAPSISASEESSVVWNEIDGQSFSATLSERSRMEANGTAGSVTLDLHGSEFYAPTLTSERIKLTTKEDSTAIVGIPAELIVDASNESRILYAGTPKISGVPNEAQVFGYRIINQNTYETFLERQEEEWNLEGEDYATSTVATNGTSYFLLERGDLSESVFRSFEEALSETRNFSRVIHIRYSK